MSLRLAARKCGAVPGMEEIPHICPLRTTLVQAVVRYGQMWATGDPFGRRIQKSSSAGTVNYVYDGANILEEVDASGNVIARYVNGPGVDEPLAVTRGGVTSYHEAGGLGTITSLSNSSAALANAYTYDSFGNPPASTGTVTNPFRFTGREYDQETGLYFYRARYYDARIGRFISQDSLQFWAGNNFYRYVRNSPGMYIDPSGHAIVPDADSSADDIKQLGDALSYLRRDPVMADIIRQLATDPNNNYIISMRFPSNWGNQQLHNQVFWNPHMANKCKNGGYQTPAMGLGHELAHLVNPTDKKPDRQYGDTEERRVIEGPEHHACQTLHECIRWDHSDTPSAWTPTSTTMPK